MLNQFGFDILNYNHDPDKMQLSLKEPTRTRHDENFPVASWLIPASLRPHVHTFYLCVRAADDIADSTDYLPDEKKRILTVMDDALIGKSQLNDVTRFAHNHRVSAAETGVTVDHARQLLQAFMMDISKLRYRNWSELINYCMHSAAPVGRYLIDLHGESDFVKPQTDCLCNALQILNHLQDCQEDYRKLNRVYIPMDYLRDENIDVTELDKASTSAPLRQAMNIILDRTDELLLRAKSSSAEVNTRGLKLEISVIIRIAEHLSGKLRRHDPLAMRVKLTKSQTLFATLQGILAGFLGR